jgi:hypothetical protein
MKLKFLSYFARAKPDARACDRLAKDNWKLVTFLTNNVNWQIWDGSNSASEVSSLT